MQKNRIENPIKLAEEKSSGSACFLFPFWAPVVLIKSLFTTFVAEKK